MVLHLSPRSSLSATSVSCGVAVARLCESKHLEHSGNDTMHVAVVSVLPSMLAIVYKSYYYAINVSDNLKITELTL